MEQPEDILFLFDVDNTLLDNDAAKADLAARVEALVGAGRAAAFWETYEAVRREKDYVDYPLTLARFRAAFPDEPAFPYVADLVLAYPYGERVYPGALAALAHVRTLGTAAILSDGDPVYQPAKIARAGLATAVGGNVLVFVHKEANLEAVTGRFPARRYVLVDDKPDVLARSKARLGDRLLTLHVRQGKYAHAPRAEGLPPPDLERASIADLQQLTRADVLARG